MAIIHDASPEPTSEMSAQLKQACDDFRQYVQHILKPANENLDAKVRKNEVALHEAYGANLIAAHSVDYLVAVRRAAGIETSRPKLVVNFDEKFAVDGAYIRNRKMELIDAINNGLKHIRLRPTQYAQLIARYGQISFGSLKEDNGRVMCYLDAYRFDYCRVVLLPALRVLSSWDLHNDEDVLDFAKGDFVVVGASPLDMYDADDPSTAIDRMVELCNSVCANCDESPDDCECAEYVFAGEQGQYEPLHSATPEELDELMGQISPSYRKS